MQQVPGELLEQHYQVNCKRSQSLKNSLHGNSSSYHHPAKQEITFLLTNTLTRLKIMNFIFSSSISPVRQMLEEVENISPGQQYDAT